MPGLHLTVDGSDCASDLLWNPDALKSFLEDLPDRIGMRVAVPPHVYTIRCDIAEDSGLSGFIVIYESHISFHTWPLKRFVYLDVFSCRPFDTDAAVAHIREAFGMGDAEVHVVNRGGKFPLTAAPDKGLLVNALAAAGVSSPLRGILSDEPI